MVTNIQDAKILIQSPKAKERGSGLKDLVHILKHNRGKPSLEALSNKAYLALCETLFQCLRDEQANFLRNRHKAKPAPHLPLAASALRHVIASGVRTIKSSTVEVIIDTITEVLPGNNGLIEPLLEDLPKTLRSVFEYQPHVERLSKDCWDAAVDLCIESLAELCSEPAEAEPQNSWSTSVSSRARTPLESTDFTSSRASPRPQVTRNRQASLQHAHAAEDFVHCLYYLVKASNAPLLDKADNVLTALLHYLQQRTGRGSVAAAAFAAINSVLARITLQSLDLTKRTVLELLPLMKSMWSEAVLRDEIMINLMYTEAHIASLLLDPDDETTSSSLEALVETMYSDYRRRQDTTAHQYLEEDHLCFRHLGPADQNTHPLNTCAFSMEMEHERYEGLWSTVSTIARFSFMLDERRRTIAHDRSDSEESFSKRIRVTQLFPEYLCHVSEPRSNAKRAALQVVTFMVQEGPFDEDVLQTMVEKLTSCISDENPVHSAWSMIGLAGAALQRSASHPALQLYWISAWQSASRVVTSTSVSRAACHLMDVLLRLKIVPFSSVSTTVQSLLLSIELSGPALLTESSSSLFTTILQERIKENPTHFSSTAERILNWLISKWTPGLWSERTYSSSNAHHCNARDVLSILYACLDRPFNPPKPTGFLVLGPVAQARTQIMRHKDLAEYLLLLPVTADFTVKSDEPACIVDDATSDYHLTPMGDRITDFCMSELNRAQQRWKDTATTNLQGITSDMMRIITNLCIVASAVATLSDPDDHRIRILKSSVTNLIESFSAVLAKPQTEQYKVDAVLEACARSLPSISSISQPSSNIYKTSGVYQLSRQLSKALRDRKDIKQSFYAEEEDMMDVDGEPNSQMAIGAAASDIDVPRHDVQAEHDVSALRASCAAYLQFISSLAEDPESEQNEIPSRFVNYLISLPENDLLRSRPFLRELWNSSMKISRIDCLNLLERFSEALIDPRAREYNTSEVANSMFVEALIGTTLVWVPDATEREAQDLYDNVEALYAYYVKEMEKGGVRRSATLQTTIAVFLSGLLKHHPEFAQNRKVPSVRTSLFDLLSRGEMTVKYHIAQHLPRMFEYFVLREHDKILQDVDSSLPGDDEGSEGIAVRLLVLSRLASQWHTLLRHSVYRMFATAGTIQGAAYHAQRCISHVARSRGLGDSQSLFRLFAPQVIFTWLDRGQKIRGIPFLIFDYTSLPDLLQDIEAEVVGQAIMFGRKDEVEFLADQLESSAEEVLAKNIGKAAAYTIAWDTCRGSARNKADSSCGNLLKDMVGSDKYYSLIQKHFPQVLGHILQTMDHEERVGKSLEKKAPFNSAAAVLAEITSINQSAQGLNIGIEPSFSAFYLPDQLERLCRRTGDKPAGFWSSSTYTYAMRSLLDRIHPALGSLYARSMIRKIRIIVALAGPIAHEGYPLQMTLQSLRPFLTDVQCAEDTVGIMQYLFEHGAAYLRQHLSFVTGIGLSILISLRVFLGSSQESTTQQSQHLATMNAANRFHTWLTEYLKAHAQAISTSERSSVVKAFRLITTTASQVNAEGNSVRGSEESKLLLEILDDVRSGRKLLNKTSRDVALDLLCQNFHPAPTARDDVLGTDYEAAEFAPLVWESSRRSKVGDGYLLWTARVLGRAYSAYGEVKKSSANPWPWSYSSMSSKSVLGKVSREAIVEEVIDLFYSDDRSEVSLAEDAVRCLISRLEPDSQYLSEMQRVIPEAIGKALVYRPPQWVDTHSHHTTHGLYEAISLTQAKPVSSWIRDLAVALCRVAVEDPILGALPDLLTGINHMAETLLPWILHLVLLDEYEAERQVHDVVSKAIADWFDHCNVHTIPHVRILIQSILYLRSQPVPKEATRVERDRWLEVDYMKAAQAADICGMHRSALLFAETSSSQPIVKSSTRRSSVMVDPPKIPLQLQLSIYKNLDEPDSFYGVDRGSSLLSVVDRLDYEGDGVKSLLFRGARLDSQMRRRNEIEPVDSRGTVKSLIMLNMNSVTHSLLSNDQFRDAGDDVVESTLHTARKLGQWDIKAPEVSHTEASTLFKAFQGLHFAKSAAEAQENLDRQLRTTMNFLSGKDNSSVPAKVRLRTLGALTEADDIIKAERSEHLLDIWDRMKAREKWMRAGEFNDVRQLLSCRETLFNVLGSNVALVDSLHTRTATIRGMEAEALVSSSSVCRKHGALQESLASVTYLSDIVPECKAIGLDIEATAQHEVANVLWEQGETEISIRMRQHLIDHADFDSQNADLSLPVLLARLGHHLAEARLAKPDTIMKDYLEPAILELKGQHQGSGPGQVFHEFALFCDKQLQSPEAAEDMDRIKTVMDRKLQEYHDFTKLSKTDKSKGMRETYHRNARRAKTWYDLDNAEYERMRKGREQFLRQCLENYLLSLSASDEYNHDALRVFSLWLEYSDTTLANQAVKAYLKDVPSGKFALLMNQLSSRLQADENDFQHLLMELVFRICVEHPYHGMHQIFAIQMKVGAITREDVVRAKDESAKSRQKAAAGLANALSSDKRARSYWSSIYQSNEIYHHLAMFKSEKESTQQGRELQLDRYKESKDLVNKVPKLNVPPATLQIEVRPNMNYSDLPRIAGFRSTMSIANGLSAPKVITAKGTDGKPYKQLFKSGNDDLRQDAIMEQVFDQVSRLLKNHTATRIRNLGIRTYKVLPLSTRSGLMEFVQNTVPLHLWVMPAHEKYYPNDYKPDRCRKEIGACQQDSLTTRVKVWQKIADNFHPVMRYFLLERFEDPDEWFERRLAYTRSTAAISILGHVLGLGDRHCHNILLDEKSGEVVHIDLGVSFEAGRVLPVPEVVPFRLTRDLVDGMGYTKTEGVFRRCCEFTMDTLREERESIMTLLNVLRYDPLVNWSVTPTKAKRMQEANQETGANGTARSTTVAPSATPAPSGQTTVEEVTGVVQESNKRKEKEDQAGEAGRALSVVEKKLSKTLSTKATVNELIQQATDERNLAVLYMGWASYA
ncbi:TEL1 Phosphatidylinositol kinase and protein kinase of the PI-3 kinase family [Pyrenophora tritici-repentis]|uniref:Serine/threonine-protein kinase Tel1 n=1 Tax=Pyrenophora tritici-repentis TaxID=45151 RepID=A0A2W1GDK3_9PLEO|nr:TEL1, Phosphatidylinositol kinase and protein kinase PI-3 kinase family [Pyrenophora tritici-repentis]KAG9383520.1 TEL1 Phosphatidylinositol kinase and protein kinase PI-3 kinase family [Pyrenophora tritici-repentis]KAI0585700.1 TEL1 Phosphatidylinositol kinase and protein kinase PI-3 kinase family [Pyrenophora tritici-repentis]KAI0590935.1 TEL1 Phosphatidylinositol kinase and protein kinase PI-3 kinase family [Pyrenophora tritici-repentis]KAI0614931.1 TEL1 Phosphatidylinositol kinase and pr